MYNFMEYKCQTVGEVQAASENLDKARFVKLKYEDNKDVNNFVGVFNEKREELCNIVSSRYNLVQHKDYFSSVAESLDRLGIKFEMKLFQQKNKAYADIDFTDRNMKFDKLNEEFITGLRVTNSYDKSTSLCFQIRLTRLACMNGMILSRFVDNEFSIRHSQLMAKEIDKFVELSINKLINSNEELQSWISISMKDSTEWLNAAKLCEKLFERFKHREQILKRLGISCFIVKNPKTKEKSVSYVNDNSLQNVTRWALYNAITNYLTESKQITPMIEEVMQKKAEMLLYKNFDSLIDKPVVEVV